MKQRKEMSARVLEKIGGGGIKSTEMIKTLLAE
jgi:hypothetical protein